MSKVCNSIYAAKEWWDATEEYANKYGMNRSKFIIRVVTWFMENFREDVNALHIKPKNVLHRWMMEG